MWFGVLDVWVISGAIGVWGALVGLLDCVGLALVFGFDLITSGLGVVVGFEFAFPRVNVVFRFGVIGWRRLILV